MKKVGYLGAGTWGIALASLLARQGHTVSVWTRSPSFAERLQQERVHPQLPGLQIADSLLFTHHMEQVLEGADVLVESVTSAGVRPVFERVLKQGPVTVPFVLTSKGIEQKTGLLLPEILVEMAGCAEWVGCLTGPSLAEEVIGNLPTSVVCSAYQPQITQCIQHLFTGPCFRVYPNSDLNGVCFGGAMKNIFAIACGISDGLGNGDNAKASLMTRGLHEMRKLCVVKGCNPETLNGLSGMGDLCLTCMSPRSRNYRLGRLLAEGWSPEGARQKIGMAVEGIYSCVSARELGRHHHIAVPITEVTYSILYEGLDPKEAVRSLLQRVVKKEHL